MRLIGGMPTAGEIAGVAVRAALSVARMHPTCPTDRIADLAVGNAIARAALFPADQFSVEAIEKAVHADLREQSVQAGHVLRGHLETLTMALVETTGLHHGNASTMARAAIVMAGQIGIDVEKVMTDFEARYSRDGGYRLVHDGVVLAQLVEPLKQRRRS